MFSIHNKTAFRALCSVLSLTLASATFADEEASPEEEWDVLNPPFELNDVTIETDEVTWSSLDLSPDGKQMVFDALGDIFLVPTGGGDAKALTQDFAWNLQPRFSPDGKSIAFVSDRGGISNIWVMDLNGENLRQISEEKKNLVHSPAWSPDGRYIAASKGIMSRRSIPAGEIWLYHIDGGDGVQLKARPRGNTEQKNISDPAFSPDGKYLYFTRDRSAGGTFSYNRDPLKSIFDVSRYSMADGEEEVAASRVGGAVAPMPSPDGSKLAFISRIKNRTALFVKDLKSGAETAVYQSLERDMQEGFGTEGYFAYYDWMPDSESIVFWTGGKFHRIQLSDQSTTQIPVQLKTTLKVADALRFPVEVAPDEYDVKMTRWASQSPNGNHVVFQALGKLYTRNRSSGKVSRVTRQKGHDEFYPAFSADGKKIAYSTWSDKGFGSLRIASTSGGVGRVVSSEPGHYKEVAFSPDGKKLVYRKSTGGYLLSPLWSQEPGLYVMELKSGRAQKISQSGFDPHFSPDGSRVYFTDGVAGSDYPETQLVSVDLNGEDLREHAYGADQVSEYRVSPDGQWLAFIHQNKPFVLPYTETGKKLTIGPSLSSVTLTQLSESAAEHIRWSGSEMLSWHYGADWQEIDVLEATAELEERALPSSVSLAFSQKSDKPSGIKALVGARVVTMRNANSEQEVIENAVIVINSNRIAAVGAAEDVSIPAGATILDVSGKTILPGLVDAHAHGGFGSEEVIPRQNWMQYSNLAFGVTTIHDPSNDSSEVFAASEMQRAGLMVAPRVYSTGTILYGAEDYGYKAIINSVEDAQFHMKRMQQQGAISVKSYNQQARSQRQQVLAAAKELNMMVVPEGGGKYQQNISMLVDGHTGLEHSLSIPSGYDDLTQLWAASGFGYTPTFVVSYGGMMGEEYFYDRTEVWKNPRLLRYTPAHFLDGRSIRRPTAPDNQYNHVNVARYAKTLRDAGVTVHIGAHGQREGLGAHWELWIMGQGGFTPWEALRSGTIDGATHLGMDKDIGSIEVGKLADLVVIEADVLSDIRNSEFVSHTVLNGRIFEAATMNEVGGKQRAPFFFEADNEAYMPDATQKRVEAKAERHHWVH